MQGLGQATDKEVCVWAGVRCVCVYVCVYSGLCPLQLLLEVQSLKKEREANSGVIVKLEAKIKLLEGQLAKSKEDLQIATKLRSSLEAARSKSPDLHSQRKHTSNLEAKLKQLETQLVVAKVSMCVCNLIG